MATKRHITSKKSKKRGKRAKPARPVKTGQVRKRIEAKKPSAVFRQIVQQPIRVEPPARERLVVTVENIRGETAIGDLLVTFPRTREILVRKGLKLEAEDAGDIYLTLDAFSAMNGLKTESLVEELVEVAKQPLPQQPAAQFVATPAV